MNAVIPDEVFTFNPPEDYEIVKIDDNGVTSIIREKGGTDGAVQKLHKATKEKDVKTLKGLLQHEKWQIRLRALQVLEHLLEHDKKQLKGIAIILEKDTKEEVRAKAERILKQP